MNFKPLKLAAHVGCWIPLSYLVYAAIFRLLGADPQEEMLHQLGLWTLILLLSGLSLTPLNRIFSIPKLIQYRRMLGLYAFFYLVLHILVFFWFYLDANLAELFDEVIKRPYVTLGMLATLLMLPLVLTSTRAMQRKLGKRWKKLHQLVYLIAILGCIHFIWQSKSDLNEPLIYFIWLVSLFSIRAYFARKKAQ
ncbi:MAG: protein-methionine-sulfoxide reductase heme-binding subunit MsrQ [Enterobacterales bacterium]|nr:protein-methionine-sulfoxide reductase heme-binding subunit MsrQ [Enterobacterales bacterium]